MTNERQNVETVVIDDNPEFIDVARIAYGNIAGLTPIYFSDYDSAVSYIGLNRSKVGRVVTDLFFPSLNIDWRDPRVLDVRDEGYGIRSIDVTGNPSGLGIAKHCSEKRIPFVILSQGDRHCGEFGKVREYLYETDNFLRRYVESLDGHTDDAFLYSGSGNLKVTEGMKDKLNSEEFFSGDEQFYRWVDNEYGRVVDKVQIKTWIDALDGDNNPHKTEIITLLHLAKRYPKSR